MSTWAESRCEKFVARKYVDRLVGDPDAESPGGRPYWHLFARLNCFDAEMEYRQIAQLPEHDRLRDMMERLDVDGKGVA